MKFEFVFPLHFGCYIQILGCCLTQTCARRGLWMAGQTFPSGLGGNHITVLALA